MDELDLADLFPDTVADLLFGCSGTVDHLDRSVSIFRDRVVIHAGRTPPGAEAIERSGIVSWAMRDAAEGVEVRVDDATSHRTLIPLGSRAPLVAALTAHLGPSTDDERSWSVGR